MKQKNFVIDIFLPKLTKKYDLIVIGAGHAGVEVVAASALMGWSTLLITKAKDNIGQMSCNLAIGGVASWCCNKYFNFCIASTHIIKVIGSLDL